VIEQPNQHPDTGLATAFNLGPIILTITRVADGRFVEVNERFLSTTGYTRDEVLGRTPLDLQLWVHPEQRREGLMRLREGQPVREIEAEFRMKIGQVHTCLMSADLITFNGEPCALTALTDITERKQAEAVLERYHLLSERTRDIILFIRPDGQIVDANAAAVAAYGYDHAALLSKNISDLRAPPTVEQISIQMQQADAGGILFTTSHRRSNGSTFPVEVSSIGADIGGEHLLLSIIRDITEREQAEAERADLLAREHAARLEAEDAVRRVARLQALTAALSRALTPAQVARIAVEHGLAALNAQYGLLALLTADGAQLETVQFEGYPADILANRRSVAINASDPLAQAVRNQALVTVETAEEHAAYSAASDAGALIAVPLVVDERALGVLGLSFESLRHFSADDRSLMWALARQSAQALNRTQLYDAERLARSAAEAAVHIRDTFLTTAAHELKTPLTVLLGNVQLLQRRLGLTGMLAEREDRLLRIVGEQANRLNRLIGAMLDISHLESRQLTIASAALDLGALVQRVVDDVRPTLAQHTVTYDPPDTLLMIEGDELRLEQVLQNLLSNAVKYSPNGGPITVQVERQEGIVCVVVSDQGIGIPQADLPKLFQRFYRAENVDPRQISGMGIGLYVVRAIVELHGGKVDVVSREGGGSIFTVCLPERRS
jgi:PAS domain S-box-containing protein